jgi:hypothetical protein
MRGTTFAVTVGAVLALGGLIASVAGAQSLSFTRVDPDPEVGSNPVDVATADFDGDDKIDIAAANNYSFDVSVLFGNGDGTFRDSGTTLTLDDIDSAPSAVATGDVNGDGKIDIIVTDEGADMVAVFLNQGGGVFDPAKTTETGTSPEALVVDDFDRDGKLDVATADLLDDTVTILRGVGDGTFTDPQVIPVGDLPIGLAGGDIDGDGKIDVLAVANSYGGADSNGTVSILKRLEGGVFEEQPEISSDSFDAPFGIALVDLNADDKLDLVVANYGADYVSVLLGTGELMFQAAADLPVGVFPEAVVVADFSGDGQLDIATSNNIDDNVSVLVGVGNGTFMPAMNFDVGGVPCGMASDDFDGNDKPDLVTANSEDSTVSVLLNTSSAGCFGDCDGMGGVTVTDIIKMVNVALDNQPVSTCMAGAQNDRITVTEIIKAVNNALGSCAA